MDFVRKWGILHKSGFREPGLFDDDGAKLWNSLAALRIISHPAKRGVAQMAGSWDVKEFNPLGTPPSVECI